MKKTIREIAQEWLEKSLQACEGTTSGTWEYVNAAFAGGQLHRHTIEGPGGLLIIKPEVCGQRDDVANWVFIAQHDPMFITEAHAIIAALLQINSEQAAELQRQSKPVDLNTPIEIDWDHLRGK